MKTWRKIWIAGLGTLLAAGGCRAEDVLFVRNNLPVRIYIKANGEWQGYVDPGRVDYMPQEGFVTSESGFQDDGTLKVEHSYGGWAQAARFEIEMVSAMVKEGDKPVVYQSAGSDLYTAGYKQWGFGDGRKGGVTVPSSLDTENAGKMRSGSPPKSVLDLLAGGASEVKTDSGGGVTGAGYGNITFPLKQTGGADEAGETFTNSIGMKMIKVPGMDYFLAATEITQKQWRVVRGRSGAPFDHASGDDLPAARLPWDLCVEVCEKLTEMENNARKLPLGYRYVLPSKKQWQFAHSAGKVLGSVEVHDGDEYAWWSWNSEGEIQKVAQKRPNVWGFYDMHGNVAEWCSDPYEVPWLNTFGHRVYCGGSVMDGNGIDSHHPAEIGASAAAHFLGFRPALVPSK